MIPIIEHILEKNIFKNKKPLILGKGPTFNRIQNVCISDYISISLNHSVRETPVDFAHFIDIEALTSCASIIEKNAKALILPWFPHVKNGVGTQNLQSYCDKIDILKKYNDEGRLYWYNAQTSSNHNPGSVVVPVKYFSAEAVVSILCLSKIKEIFTLGIDGGTQYSSNFSDIEKITKLSNGHDKFNYQFENIIKMVRKHNVKYRRLGDQFPIQVCIGMAPEQILSAKVLEYSILKNTPYEVKFTHLCDNNINYPLPQKKENRPRTTFSFQRFLIPQLMNFKGKAIYVDSDMQVFTDIENLWNHPFNGNELLVCPENKSSGRVPQFSVMVIDCEKLQWNIGKIVNALDNNEYKYEDLMYQMCVAKKIGVTIPWSWNSLEYYSKEVKLIHYTDMEKQPWAETHNPLSYIWFKDLFEAIESRYISRIEIQDQINKKWIRPSLDYQIEKNITDPILISRKKLNELDKDYTPIWRSIHAHSGKPWKNPFALIKAKVRSLLQSRGLTWNH